MWKKIGMKKKLIVPYVVLMSIFSVSVYFFVSLEIINPLILDKLAADQALGYSLLDGKYPGDWSVRDEKLYKGEQMIEGETTVVDEIKKSTNSVATIFRGNTRVATCVLKDDGSRAVGTKVAPEVEAAVLKGGDSFIGTAKVVGKPYQTKYSPIRDKSGTIIGMWFVGVDKGQIASFDMMMGIFVAIFMVIGVAIPYWISTTIARQIKSAVDEMQEAAHQVASASNQVSASSQSLAEGASEQAAAMEETSSSLEEMSAMTKQNAGNATQADVLMKQANQVVHKANESMQSLTGSMKEIITASEETSKIIKTIDEISFQTNLLALNAAVEAARAGEAGAGFAVVAEEVRNLAMRAADAARNTSGLIEGTVKKIKDGSSLVTKTNEAFAEVAVSASKVGELVGEIAAASQEQAQGIDQVNKSVAEMGKVTQQTAANAEESASASEEMNAQAEQMRHISSTLARIIGGNVEGTGNGHGKDGDV
jgi:methyl-accepting chemotaxis protein